ncbi:hypothetical protein EVAR_26786_1 [Eumeta japonica]|uniref:Uncharacterized protein n=1 Tax=Eumeta variegata TaxID=151549 RepID=A0A4C1XF54_EUMVA|nr:hypothetical protein EVAR_26786_1 [Eumeta japonica]
MRLGSLAGDCSPLNDIVSTNDIDNAIGTFTKHIKTVVDDSLRVVLVNSDRKELPRDVSELIRAKNGALRRASKYSTCENRYHAHALRKVKVRIQECSDNLPYNFEDAQKVEEEVHHRISLPPKNDLDPISQDEISKILKPLKSERPWA